MSAAVAVAVTARVTPTPPFLSLASHATNAAEPAVAATATARTLDISPSYRSIVCPN
jgi:hypothetical protein